jgi:hypothetical protein
MGFLFQVLKEKQTPQSKDLGLQPTGRLDTTGGTTTGSKCGPALFNFVIID